MKPKFSALPKFIFIALVAAIIFAATSFWIFVNALNDTTPPGVISFECYPILVDTNSDAKTITFTVHLTDDLSGIGSNPQARFRSPSQNQFTDVVFSPTTLVSGNNLNGLYVSTLTLPQYSESGIWTVEYLFLMDQVGNQRWLYSSDLASLNFSTTFSNTAVADDSSPPNAISFELDPIAINTNLTSQNITFTVHITDDLSGVGSNPQARFRSPSQNQFADAVFSVDTLISGNELDGIYRTSMLLPKYSEIGDWYIEYLFLMDKVGNQKWLYQSEIISNSFDYKFTITDTTHNLYIPLILRKSA